VSFASLKSRLKSLLRWRRQPLSEHLRLGSRGERLAERALRRDRHRVLARNYRCPAGEIDLITADGDEVVFIEVKTRRSDARQDPADAVTPGKWLRIERAGRYFLRTQTSANRPYRFDMVTIVWPVHGKPVVEHVPNAHTPRNL
jgi:putative endonuclease